MKLRSIYQFPRHLRLGLESAVIRNAEASVTQIQAMSGVRQFHSRFVSLPIRIALRAAGVQRVSVADQVFIKGIKPAIALLRCIREPQRKLPRRYEHSLRLQAARACIFMLVTQPVFFCVGVLILPGAICLTLWQIALRLMSWIN
jgi:hypothetical protein